MRGQDYVACVRAYGDGFADGFWLRVILFVYVCVYSSKQRVGILFSVACALLFRRARGTLWCFIFFTCSACFPADQTGIELVENFPSRPCMTDRDRVGPSSTP